MTKPETPAPGSLAEVRTAKPGVDRCRAAVEHNQRAEKAAADSAQIRDDEIRRLVRQHGPKATADLLAGLPGCSIHNIRVVARGVKQDKGGES